jgi:hypothetical protein
MNNPPLISLCVIVGNVEEYITRFLDSFAPAADEIVIVRAIGHADPDATLPRVWKWAEDHGREVKTADYYNSDAHSAWPHVDDFAAARNLSFSMATGTYCMWADTDDILEPGAAEAIRRLAERGGEPCWMMPYRIFGRGVSVPRERLILRGSGKWVFPVHECFQFHIPRAFELETSAVITHLPHSTKTGSNDRNLRILEAIPAAERTSGQQYHLAGEYRGARRTAEFIREATACLQRPDLGTPERYELLLDLAAASTDPEVQVALIHSAYSIDNTRREALALLTGTFIDYGKAERALAYARQMMSTPEPREHGWNSRQNVYGWLGTDIYQQALRVNGEIEEADRLRFHTLRSAKAPVISLIHATRGRPKEAALARKRWLDLAELPERVEHIFVMDSDDEASFPLRRMHHVTIPPGGGCVAAWNYGANTAVGNVLVQMSDDWLPPPRWDAFILERLGDLDQPRVLAVSDGHRTDRLLCMAICTSAYYGQDFYLFHPWFTGVYSDNWFTDVAYDREQVIEARDLVFTHLHPAFDPSIAIDATYAAQNDANRYTEGRAVYDELHLRRDWSTVPGFFNYWIFYTHVATQLQDGDSFAEIGVWLGRSIIFLAQLLKIAGKKVTLYAIDTFAGELNQPAHEATIAAHGGSLRAAFEANLSRCGVADMITIIQSDSAAAAQYFRDAQLAGCFIDAAHDYASVCRDLAAWTPKVRPTGLLSGHDAQDPEVRRAVAKSIPQALVLGPIWKRP